MIQRDVWPDWSARPLAIVACGPSARLAGVEALQGRATVLAIKKSVELVPFADAVYGCDGAWWRGVAGLPDFRGLRLAHEPRACGDYGLRRIGIPQPKGDALLFGETGVVGAGGNSGFQALNLAVQLGARRILLVGFDCSLQLGLHWYGRNKFVGQSNPDEDNFRRWKAALEAAAPVLAARGVEVVDAAPRGALQAYPKASVAEALERWAA